MENHTADNTSQQTPQKERPLFLTILCILSFVGNGLYIFYGLFYFLTMHVTEQAVNFSTQVMAENSEINPLFGFFMQVSELMEYMPLLNAVNIVAAVINVIGVIFMWKLQKVGFYIYAVTELAPVVIWSVIYFQVLGGLGLFMSTPAVIIALVFTFLFALNLKHMR